MSLLRVENLHVAFRTSGTIVEAVKGISFSVEKGETLALVGESGSGKSVSAFSVLGLLPYPKAFHSEGRILFQDQDILQKANHVRGLHIGMIFQEPMMAFNPLHTIGRQIEEPLTIHFRLTPQEREVWIQEAIDLAGFPKDRLSSYPHELSGGQRQRAMIAMALVCKPDLLIADEPTTALDVTLQDEILRLLQSLQERLSMGILLITHNLGIVKRMAHRVAVMEKGKIVEQGTTVFSNPQHSYTQRLLNSEPTGEPAPLKNEKVVLQAENLNVSFPIKRGIFRRVSDEVRAVKDVSFTLKEGETIGIVGESGSGKTTLAMALLHLEKSTGSFFLEGTPMAGLSAKAFRPFRRHIQVVFQDPFGALNPRLTVGQIVGEGYKIHYPEGSETEVQKTLERVGLEASVMDRFPHEFSGGQRQRIAIARALILKPKVLVLDEPTSALDLSIQKDVIELLRTLQTETGMAYLFISHDLKVVRAMSHRIMIMKNGSIVEEGEAEKVYTHPQTAYAQRLMAAAQAWSL